MKLARVLAPLLAALLLAADCGEGITSVSGNGFSVRARPNALLLFNGSPDPIHYVVFDDWSVP